MAAQILRAIRISIPGSMVLLLPIVKADEVKMKPKDLPIYEFKPINPPEYYFELHKPNTIQESISHVRQRVWKISESMQGTVDKTKEVCNKTQAVYKDVVHFVQTEEGIVPRIIAISMAGVLGVFLGARGGPVRRMLYAGGLMTATTSLCYPKQSVAIATNAYSKTADKTMEFYKTQKAKRSEKKSQSTTSQTVAHKAVISEPPQTPSAVPVDVDHGQSKSEDKDMYTTRS